MSTITDNELLEYIGKNAAPTVDLAKIRKHFSNVPIGILRHQLGRLWNNRLLFRKNSSGGVTEFWTQPTSEQIVQLAREQKELAARLEARQRKEAQKFSNITSSDNYSVPPPDRRRSSSRVNKVEERKPGLNIKPDPNAVVALALNGSLEEKQTEEILKQAFGVEPENTVATKTQESEPLDDPTVSTKESIGIRGETGTNHAEIMSPVKDETLFAAATLSIQPFVAGFNEAGCLVLGLTNGTSLVLTTAQTELVKSIFVAQVLREYTKT